MDYRFLVQKSLSKWEYAIATGYIGSCPFCLVFADEDCGDCPMGITNDRGCTEMVLCGRTWNGGLDNKTYILGCIAFYTEWLRTGIMPTVEYR